MLIPYSTDAPLYHYPIATGGLIVVNTLLLAATWGNPQFVEALVLHYGEWNPLQWLTSMFVHVGPVPADGMAMFVRIVGLMNLVGNMVFLWIFGLIVEGKIGWWKMLLLYLGIGLVESAVEQTLMLGKAEGASFGASAAIYGLLAVAMVWAPLNDITCLWLVGFRTISMDVKIWALAFMYLAYEVALAMIGGFGMGGDVFRLLGAMLGAGFGAVMVNRKWVDCENWDLFSVRKGRHRMTREQLTEEKSQHPEKQEKRKSRREEALKQIRALMEEGNPVLAWSAHDHCRRTMENWTLPEADLLRLISKFQEKGQWKESIPVMTEYLRRPDATQAAVVRLHLARVLLEKDGRPAQALRVLAKIPAGALNESQAAICQKMQAKATKLHEEDPYEVAFEDW